MKNRWILLVCVATLVAIVSCKKNPVSPPNPPHDSTTTHDTTITRDTTHHDSTAVSKPDTGFVKGSAMAITGAASMCWPTPEYGYACGIYGEMCASTDSGMTWKKLNSPTDQDLYAISFSSASIGLAAGGFNMPIILRTTDAGATWLRTSLPRGCKLIRDVKVIPDMSMSPLLGSAIACGVDSSGKGIILLSSDGGQHWTLALTTPKKLNSIAITKEGPTWQAIVVGDSGQIYTTPDGGKAWATGGVGWSNNSGNSENLVSVSFYLAFGQINYDAVIGTDNYSILWSTDMGHGWVERPITVTNRAAPISGVLTPGGNSGDQVWVACHSNSILHGFSRGGKWADETMNSLGTQWNCIAARDSKHIAFAGEGSTLYWYVLK